MKLSSNPYNILVPVWEKNEYLLYNTFTGGIEVLTFQEGLLFSEMMTLDFFIKDTYSDNKPFIENLIEKGYIDVDTADFISLAEEIYIKKKKTETNSTIFLTIGTTILCNMGCSYCFEFVKPNNTLKDDNVIAQIGKYIEEIIESNKDTKWRQLSVTWYGGEPLINMKGIKKLGPILYDIAIANGMYYNADLITNGIYLTPENVKILQELHINKAQVTIDGAREVHDKNRPLKIKNGKNYFQIVENLAALPDDFGINIRVNVDRNVAETLDVMLDDLSEYDIWPRRYKNFSFTPAWLRTYDGEEINEQDLEARLTVDEFFDIYQNFRLKQIDRFNEWALNKGLKKARLSWDLPKFQTDCPTWANPNGIVVDPLGNVHKCWETIHDDTKASATVFDGYDANAFSKYTSFNRYDVNPVCRSCKYLPVCDQISCAHHAINHDVPQCSYWKYKTEDFLKEQYIRMLDRPDTIAPPANADAVNSGHSNK